MAAALKSRPRATRGRYRTRGQAAALHPLPPATDSSLGSSFLVLRKAQETLYFGHEINSPHTVNLYLCKRHGPDPTRDRWPRLLPPAVIWERAFSALPAALHRGEFARQPKPRRRFRSLVSPPAPLSSFNSFILWLKPKKLPTSRQVGVRSRPGMASRRRSRGRWSEWSIRAGAG